MISICFFPRLVIQSAHVVRTKFRVCHGAIGPWMSPARDARSASLDVPRFNPGSSMKPNSNVLHPSEHRI